MPPSQHHYTSPSFGRSTDRDGFQPLNRGDAAIDIPLQDVHETAYQGPNTYNAVRPAPHSDPPSSEKRGIFNRGRRRKVVLKDTTDRTARRGYDGEEDTLNNIGKLYQKVLHTSVTLRYFIYILPLAAVLAVPIIIGATVAKDATIGDVRLLWFFVWLLCSWVGLWGSKMVAHFLPAIFQAVCGVVSSGTRKYALVLKNLEIPLSLCGWALVTLATFKPLMTRQITSKTTPEWVNVVQRILAAAMISALVFLGECLFIQIISINYHRKQFHAKIKDSKRQLYLLSLLYDASRSMFRNFCPEFAEEDAIINDTLDLSFGKKRRSGHFRSGSSTPARVLQDISNLGDKVTEAFGNVAQDITGKKNVFHPGGAHSIVTKALEKNQSCEALARRLWLSFVIEGHDAMHLDDIKEVLGPQQHAEAEEAFAIIDRDGNGDISLDEMILTISSFGRDRSSIANSMHDVDQAIKVLDRMLCVIIFVVVVFIFIAFLNTSFVTTLATAGTALLSLSFVFSVTAQEVLGSCIFLFVKHPFDIGDRVDLNTVSNAKGDQMIVEHISLLFTVFRRIDNHRTVQVPNIVLNSLWIENVSRSNAMKERLSIFVSFGTTLEDIQLLRNEMKKFVTSSENNRDFQDEVTIEVLDIHEMDKLELNIEILHKSNWSNETVRSARRSKFMCALVLALRKVPIYGPGGGDPALGAPGNPSYSVSVSDVEAASNRTAAAAAKDAARLVPSNPKSTGEAQHKGDLLGSTKELSMMDTLNERSLAFDGARDAGSSRAALATSPTLTSLRQPASLDGQGSSIEDASLLRRETTNKGRRKSNRTARSDSSFAMTTASAAAPQPPTTPLPQHTVPPPDPQAQPPAYLRHTAGSEDDEDWYSNGDGDGERREERFGSFPSPPHARQPYNADIRPYSGT